MKPTYKKKQIQRLKETKLKNETIKKRDRIVILTTLLIDKLRSVGEILKA